VIRHAAPHACQVQGTGSPPKESTRQTSAQDVAAASDQAARRSERSGAKGKRPDMGPIDMGLFAYQRLNTEEYLVLVSRGVKWRRAAEAAGCCCPRSHAGGLTERLSAGLAGE
jgi:hypothetical protein